MKFLVPMSLVFCLAGCMNSTPRFERMQEQVVKDPPTSLYVEVDNGSVKLEIDRSAGGARIEATWSVQRADQAAADTAFDACSIGVDTEEGHLSVIPVMPPDSSVELRVVMPDNSSVMITTGNGSITVTGASGEAVLATDNGSIRCVDQDGMVVARSSNGSIRIVNPTGDIESLASNGSITITEAISNVRARTGNGRIDITVQSNMAPSILAQSDNGSISLEVGPGFSGEVDLAADNGSITVEDPGGLLRVDVHDKTTRHLVIGNDDTKTSLRTSNGSVKFRIGPGPAKDDPAG